MLAPLRRNPHPKPCKINSIALALQAVLLVLSTLWVSGEALARAPQLEESEYQAMPQYFREKARSVIRFPTISKITPVPPFKSSVAAYDFLLGDLPLASKIGHAAGISSYVVEPRGKGVHATDNEGIEGMLYLVLKERGKRIYYAEGTADVGPLPRLGGRGVMELTFKTSDEGRVENDVTIWVQVDNKFIGLITKVLWPILAKVVSGKMKALGDSAQKLSEAMHSEPEKLHQKLAESGLADEGELGKLRRFLESRPAAAP